MHIALEVVGGIHCPIKEDETWLTISDTSQCPKQLRQQELTVTDKGLGWPLATHMLMLPTALIDTEVVVQLVSL